MQYSALTGQALYYLGAEDLRHKVLAIAEEEGASRASYALKLLQSEGHLTIASTGKESSTGRLVSQEYRVQGPVGLFLTTTAIDLDEELLNRCVVLTVDEDREQTRAIHRLQRARQTLEGVLARAERERGLRLHRNAQRLLRPLLVVNPYAPRLTFLDDRTRMRREHMKYLSLIKAVTLLHQHQRPVKTADVGGRPVEYLEVQPEDIAVANRLADAVLGRSLDEVPAHTRKLLVLVEAWVKAECQRLEVARQDFRFTRRQVREATGWGDTQLKVHLQRLADMEYLLVHRGPTGRGHAYELVWDGRGQDGGAFLPGLLDVSSLAPAHHYDGERSAPRALRSGRGRRPVGPQSEEGRGTPENETRSDSAGLSAAATAGTENALPGDLNSAPPYPQSTAPEVP